jgi:hypothetical protein
VIIGELTVPSTSSPIGEKHTMANVELYHLEAVKALNSGNLDEKQKQFIERIKDFDKRKLKKLSGADFKWLKDIARRNMKSDQNETSKDVQGIDKHVKE